MKEVWKNIEGYEGYQVSNTGKVRNAKSGKILKPEIINKGYYRIGLCKNGKKSKFFLHRLVALAFVPNPNNLPIVNHKDRNPLNCCSDNLEWCDSSYNNSYDSAYERRVATRRANGTYAITEETREKLRNAKLGKHSATSMKVSQFTKNGEYVATFVSMRDASLKTGVCHSSITQVCKGDRKSAGGFLWRYAS